MTSAETFVHSSEVGLGLENFRRGSRVYDVILCCRNNDYEAHKAVLTASSSYFEQMFLYSDNNDPNKNKIDKIYLDELKPEGLIQVLEYIYNERINLNMENVESVMHAAHLFQMTALHQTCTSFIISQLSPESFLHTWNLADSFSDTDLRVAVIDYCVQNYSRLRNQKTFLSLSLHRLQKIIQNSNLSATPDQILETVIEWVRIGQPDKQEEMTQLLYITRSETASRNYLQRLERDENLFSELPALRTLLLTVFRHRDVKKFSEPRPYILNLEYEMEKYLNVITFIENYKKLTVTQICTLNEDMERKKMQKAPFQVRHCGVTNFSNRIYCAGGKNISQFYATFSEYDVIEHELQSLAPMTYPRAQLALAVHKGNIYAIGGFDDSGELNKVEKYILSKDIWTIVTPMANARRGAASASFHGRLYVVGGRCQMVTISAAEYYLSDDDQWTTVTSLVYPRTNCHLTVFGDSLYCMGGFWTLEELVRSSVGNVQVYDPEEDSWRIATSLKTTSLIAGVVVWHDRLYVVCSSGWIFSFNPSDNSVQRIGIILCEKSLIRCAFPIHLSYKSTPTTAKTMWNTSSNQIRRESNEDEELLIEETKL